MKSGRKNMVTYPEHPKYPDCFPKNIHEKIIAEGAKSNKLTVYRICNKGIISRDTFISSFEEKINESDTFNRDIYLANEYHIEDYSTSCFEKIKDANDILKCKKKYHDGPILITGELNPCYGLSLREKDRKIDSIIKKLKKSHVHWWIYKNCDPSDDFEKT